MVLELMHQALFGALQLDLLTMWQRIPFRAVLSG